MADELNDDTSEPDPHDARPDGGFDASYVNKLRQEAAERRVKARDAETALQAAHAALRATRERLLDLEVEAAAKGLLADPGDLLLNVPAAELTDEDGTPDPTKIRAAAEALVVLKAHLAPPVRPTGDVDQGARPSPPAPFDFAAVLRRAAA